jgi:hypothetical protein
LKIAFLRHVWALYDTHWSKWEAFWEITANNHLSKAIIIGKKISQSSIKHDVAGIILFCINLSKGVSIFRFLSM